jgi:hypothetical protein
MKKLSYLLLVFSITIVVGIALLIKPIQLDNTSFLLALFWLLTLVIINWAISVFFFTDIKGKDSTQFGILPSLHLIVFLYSIYSVGLLIYFWSSVDYGVLPLIHWLSQLIGFGIAGIIFILILIAGKSAQISLPLGAAPKEELLDKLKVLTLSLPPHSSKTLELLNNLESVVRHSVPHASAVKYIGRYIDLTNRIMSLTTVDLTGQNSESLISDLIVLAKSC